MAEALFRHLAQKEKFDCKIASAGISDEEHGNPIHPGTLRQLRKHAVPVLPHRAHRITDDEFADADLIVCMDAENIRYLKRRFGSSEKIRLLLDREIDDPWYTGDFDSTWDDILEGCTKLMQQLRQAAD